MHVHLLGFYDQWRYVPSFACSAGGILELRGDSLALQEALHSSMLGRSRESAAEAEIEEEHLEGEESEFEDLQGEDEDDGLDFADDEPWNVHWFTLLLHF